MIPNHMLAEIERNGDEDQRLWAVETAGVTEEQRAQRISLPPWILQWLKDLFGEGETTGPHARRKILDGLNNRYRRDDQVVRAGDDEPVDDPSVNAVYDSLGTVWDYYWTQHDRDSIDDAGMSLKGIVHYGQNYNNAFWNGKSMTFGEGDGRIFRRGGFAESLDVIGHELTHGVTQAITGLRYENQPGGLNESLSDVFGMLTYQYANNVPAKESEWLIGRDLLAEEVNGDALRNMLDPGTAYDDSVLGKDPQYGHADDYRPGDNPHTSSGVPNKAFALAAVEAGGYAWKTVGPIWYQTLISGAVTPDTDWKTFAEATVNRAGKIRGTVLASWKKVGVL